MIQDRGLGTGGAGPSPTEEIREEIEEVLAGGGAVAVVVGAAGKELGQEVKEVLAGDGAVAVVVSGGDPRHEQHGDVVGLIGAGAAHELGIDKLTVLVEVVDDLGPEDQ